MSFCFMEETNEKERSAIVGRQLGSLLQQAGITIVGLAHAIDMSVNHLRTIKAGKASISSRTAGKIADFFNIEVSQLFSAKSIKIKNIRSIPTVKRFYEENVGNLQFFIRQRKENSLMHFLRTELLKSKYLEEEHDVREIREHCKDNYKRNFTSKALSAQLVRLAEEGVLVRRDKFGNGSVYLYKLATNGKRH